MRNAKIRLSLGVAGAAIIASYAAPASAACSADGSTVACDGANTVVDVNAAVAAVAGDNVRLDVEAGSTVTGLGAVTAPQQGNVAFFNAGAFGTEAAQVGVTYFGTLASATNAFSLNNSGEITGSVFVGGVGGATSIVNSGGIGTASTAGPAVLVAGSDGSVSIESSGSINNAGRDAAIIVSTTGDIDVDLAGNVGAEGTATSASSLNDVYAFSQGTVARTPASTTEGGTTTTVTGTEAVGGQVSVAVGATSAVGSVLASGFDGASVVINGASGADDDPSFVSAQSGTTEALSTAVSTVDGAASSSSTTTVTSAVGGAAEVAVGEGASVIGGVTANGLAAASVTVDGTVGSDAVTGSVFASSSGTDQTIVTETSSDGATGASSFDQRIVNTSVGGDAAVEIGSSGAVNGSVQANANGDAAVTNAGLVSGGVFADAVGSESVTTNGNSSDGAAAFASYNSTTTTSTGGAASVVNAAGALIGENPSAPVVVRASGGSAASIENAGRINGNLFASASLSETVNSSESVSDSATDATTGASTSTSAFSSESSSVNLGGETEVRNAAGALVVGAVDARGPGGVVVENLGAVTGTTFAQSVAVDTSDVAANSSETVFTPGPDGGWVFDQNIASTRTVASSGGDVTGVYAGTNGAVQFVPGAGVSDGSVTQQANGASSASVTGQILGSFTGTSTDFTRTEVTTNTRRDVFDADGDPQVLELTEEYREEEESGSSTSTLAVNGGLIEGNAYVAADGDVSVALGNGAVIGGSLTAATSGLGGYEYSRTRELLVNYDDAGVETDRAETITESRTEVAGLGDVNVTIGDATVGASVRLAGSNGSASFSLAEDGEVAGSVVIDSWNELAARERLTSTTSVAGPTGGTTFAEETTEAWSVAGGDVSAVVEGVIGNGLAGPAAYGDIASGGSSGLLLDTGLGDASATVTGQVIGNIEVYSGGFNYSYASQLERVDGVITASTSQTGFVSAGGAAELTVDSADQLTPANFGDIDVSGFSRSSVTVGQNSSVLAARNGATMSIGGFFSDVSITSADDLEGGVVVGSTSTFSGVRTGGDAALANNGWIGYDGGPSYSGSNAFVAVTSASSAEVANNGRIFGSVDVNSLWSDFESTTVVTDLGEITRVDTTDATYTARGGDASVTNAGLITGSVTVAAANADIANTGVLRGSLSLGTGVDNYSTRSVDTFTQFGEETVLDPADITPFVQSYEVAQDGLIGGGIAIGGAFGFVDDTVQTSDIQATINLNAGSVTAGGILAEFDLETGERFTTTTVNLNGSGYLGLNAAAVDALEDAFAAVDPRIEQDGDLGRYEGGVRVLGVEALNKTGAGSFLIAGANFQPVTSSNLVADYTLDVGTFTISGGEVQLATLGADSVFGIRGDIVNNAGLVLGNRVELESPLFGTNSSVVAIDGVEVYQNGDFTQGAGGTLTVGIAPTLVRVFDPAYQGSVSTNPLAVQETLLQSGLFTTPENAWGQAFNDLGTSFLTVDGDLNLGGTVELVSPTRGLFLTGQSLDIASVSGAVTLGADVDISSGSNFVDFDIATRDEGGRTVVTVTASRQGYETVALSENAAAAGAALSAALPQVVSTIQTASDGNVGMGGTQFALAQDLANIFVGLDTMLTRDEAARVMNELASGEFYGSLTALETTSPFLNAISNRRTPADARGFNVWFAPSGEFVRYDGDDDVGSAKIKADNYGGSIGFGVATGSGDFGIGFGYGRIAAESRGNPADAEATTWMIGAYGRQEFGQLVVGADLVYGWSDWDVNRSLPTMARSARAEFDSTELRGDLRIEYMVPLGQAWVAPFGELSFRSFDFDGFTEEGAGAVSLVVEDADHTVFTPSLGVKVGGEFQSGLARLRPEASVSYTFSDDGKSFRDVSYLGAPSVPFRLQGIEPDGFVTLEAGLFGDIGRNSGAFVRGSYATGGNVSVAGVNAGVVIGF